jgi:hypothetical protein
VSQAIGFALPIPPAQAVQTSSSSARTTPAPQASVAAPRAQAGASATGAQAARTQPSAGSGAAAVVEPAAAVGQSASDTASRMRAIYARIGDEVEIGLDGEGFVFLGFPDRSQANGMTFRTKEVRDGKTYFKFKAFTLGTYNLSFQRQDNATGRILGETVWVRVVSDTEFTMAMEQQTPIQPLTPGSGATDYEYAQRLVDLGKFEAALAEYMKGYREGDGLANDRIASLYLGTGDLASAEKYYKKNVSAAGQYSESAIIGLVKVSVMRKDPVSFFSYLKPLLAVKEADIGATLILAARFLADKGDVAVGLELLGEFVKRYPQGALRDEADFLSAQLLEADSPMRDIPAARDLYKRVLESYPESRFAGSAKDRLRYIEQHFYYVR